MVLALLANDRFIDKQSHSALLRSDGLILLSFFLIVIYYSTTIALGIKGMDDHVPATAHGTIFSFNAPEAGRVSLVGEFNNWDSGKHPIKCDDSGLWTKTIMLAPGIYEYKFLVDENWMTDTKNDHSRRNDYGSFNSVIMVSPWQK